MRYQKTILLTPEVMAEIREGRKLQCGQWVRTSINSPPSRWVGILQNGTVWAAHYQGPGGHREKQFYALAAVRKNDKKSFF